MPPDAREEEKLKRARNKFRDLIREYVPSEQRFDHCETALRAYLDGIVRNAHKGGLDGGGVNEDLVDLIDQFADSDIVVHEASPRQMENYFRDLLDLFPTAYDIINGARPRDPASTPHGHGQKGDPRSPISQHRSSAYGSRPITHSHDSRPMVDQGVKKWIRVISKFDPRGKRKSEEAHTADEAHKAARRANWKHATEQARPLSNHRENAISATHRVRQGIQILGPDANKSARKQEEARQRAEKWRNDLQRDARDKRPIDPGALNTLIPCREAEEARKAKEAEEAKRKAKEAEEARKAKEAEEAKRKAKEAEEAKRKAKEAEVARKAKEAEIARKAEVARKAKEAEEAKRKAKEAEEAKRKAKEAEEAKRKAKEAEEAKRKAKEAEIARKVEQAKEAERKAEKELTAALRARAKELNITITTGPCSGTYKPIEVLEREIAKAEAVEGLALLSSDPNDAYADAVEGKTEEARKGSRCSERIKAKPKVSYNNHQTTDDEEDDNDSDDDIEKCVAYEYCGKNLPKPGEEQLNRCIPTSRHELKNYASTGDTPKTGAKFCWSCTLKIKGESTYDFEPQLLRYAFPSETRAYADMENNEEAAIEYARVCKILNVPEPEANNDWWLARANWESPEGQRHSEILMQAADYSRRTNGCIVWNDVAAHPELGQYDLGQLRNRYQRMLKLRRRREEEATDEHGGQDPAPEQDEDTRTDEQRALDDEQTLLGIFEYVKNKWPVELGDKMERLLKCYNKGVDALPYMVDVPTFIRPQVIEYIREKVGNINYLWDKHRRLAMLSNQASQGAKHSLQFFVYPKGHAWVEKVRQFVLNHGNPSSSLETWLAEQYEYQKIRFDNMNRKGKKQAFKTDANFPWGIRCSKIHEKDKHVQKNHTSCERCFKQIVCTLRTLMQGNRPTADCELTPAEEEARKKAAEEAVRAAEEEARKKAAEEAARAAEEEAKKRAAEEAARAAERARAAENVMSQFAVLHDVDASLVAEAVRRLKAKQNDAECSVTQDSFRTAQEDGHPTTPPNFEESSR